ncbi:MAG: excinuclease ABC subunit UvrC, partial [Gammaproteobacteria bacterium]|nr:excinuclease ABC subunit UvrC [Gammaproteobacteria bacterium]
MGEAFDSKAFLGSLTHRPGVYRMLAGKDTVLYVGKARDLRKRVSTYFGSKAHHPKTQALMALTERVEVTVTGTEQEALLLEYNVIKEHHPRFNVVLRDDKSYPWIYVSTQQEFPRFEFHRGSRKAVGRFLGPWPNAGAVRESLAQLQKLFRVRQCSESFFANRTRPCLQYQIKRCTAPCVGLVTEADYRRDVEDAILFLEGRNTAVLSGLVARMEQASGALDYERAAILRDQITLIRRIQAEQVIAGKGIEEADVIGVHQEDGQACVAVILIRGGRVLGSRTWFPRVTAATDPEEIVAAFIGQHYMHEQPPAEILVPVMPLDAAILAAALATRGVRPVRIRDQVRGTRKRWLEMAATNASQGLASRLAAGASLRVQFEKLAEALALDEVPQRIECFDISHTSGQETVASCVVFGPDGPIKSDYRRFNIRDVEPGDDYAAIAQVVERRYARIKRGEAPLPDLILIDGGQGQVDKARAVLEEFQLAHLPLIGVSKGRDRRAGEEKLVFPGESAVRALPPDSPALLLIQQIRDEAHRFAITGHRQRRARAGITSSLESIAGLGPQRRRALLRQFGGLQGIRQA